MAIHTDSMYLINSITNWIFSWLSSDWRKRDGEPIKHKIQYRELLRMMEDVDIEWVTPSQYFKIIYLTLRLHPGLRKGSREPRR